MTPMTQGLIEKILRRLKPYDGLVKIKTKSGDVHFKTFIGSDENGFHFESLTSIWSYSSKGVRKDTKDCRHTDIVSIKHVSLDEIRDRLNKARNSFESNDFIRFLN